VFLDPGGKQLVAVRGPQLGQGPPEERRLDYRPVLEVGVAGIPDEVKGEVAKAWIVLKRDVTTAPTSDEIRAYCRERLAPYKVPAQVEFRTELPKTMVGKILRRILVAETVGSN